MEQFAKTVLYPALSVAREENNLLRQFLMHPQSLKTLHIPQSMNATYA